MSLLIIIYENPKMKQLLLQQTTQGLLAFKFHCSYTVLTRVKWHISSKKGTFKGEKYLFILPTSFLCLWRKYLSLISNGIPEQSHYNKQWNLVSFSLFQLKLHIALNQKTDLVRSTKLFIIRHYATNQHL